MTAVSRSAQSSPLPSPVSPPHARQPRTPSFTLPTLATGIYMYPADVNALLRVQHPFKLVVDAAGIVCKMDTESDIAYPIMAKGGYLWTGDGGELHVYWCGRVLRPNGVAYRVYDDRRWTDAAVQTGADTMVSISRPLRDHGPLPHIFTSPSLPALVLDENDLGVVHKNDDLFQDHKGHIYTLDRSTGKKSYLCGTSGENTYFFRRVDSSLLWVKYAPIHLSTTGEYCRIEARHLQDAATQTEPDAPETPAEAPQKAAKPRKNRKKKKTPAPATSAAEKAFAEKVKTVEPASILETLLKELPGFVDIVEGGKGLDGFVQKLAGQAKQANGARDDVPLVPSEYRKFLKAETLEYHFLSAEDCLRTLSDSVSRFLKAGAQLADDGIVGAAVAERLAEVYERGNVEGALNDWRQALADMYRDIEEFSGMCGLGEALYREMAEQPPRRFDKRLQLQLKVRKGLVKMLHEVQRECRRVMLHIHDAARMFYYHASLNILGEKDVKDFAMLAPDFYIEQGTVRKYYTVVTGDDQEGNPAPFRVADFCFAAGEGGIDKAAERRFPRLFIDGPHKEEELPTLAVFEWYPPQADLIALLLDNVSRATRKDLMPAPDARLEGSISILCSRDMHERNAALIRKAAGGFHKEHPALEVRMILM